VELRVEELLVRGLQQLLEHPASVVELLPRDPAAGDELRKRVRVDHRRALDHVFGVVRLADVALGLGGDSCHGNLLPSLPTEAVASAEAAAKLGNVHRYSRGASISNSARRVFPSNEGSSGGERLEACADER